MTKHLYTLPVQWGVAAYGVNLSWWNKLDPAVRDFLQKVMTEVQEKQWALGLELTEDGIACNGGDKDKCKIGRVVEARPMTITRATDADMATLRKSLTDVVLPAWIKRCGAKCGETYNRLVAPITGVKYEPK